MIECFKYALKRNILNFWIMKFIIFSFKLLFYINYISIYLILFYSLSQFFNFVQMLQLNFLSGMQIELLSDLPIMIGFKINLWD